MRSTWISRVAAPVGGAWIATLLSACAEHIPPKSLVDARAEFARARGGIAMQFDPTDVHEADLALQRAEGAWNDAPDEPITVDLAILAERKAQIAEAEATALQAQREADEAKRALTNAMSLQLQAARGQLDQTKQQLQAEQAAAAEQSQKLADLEAKLKDARDTIAKIAAVKDDDRGMVITLQGEVLFQTNKWDLKPGAMAKLDQIADALRGKEQPMIVFGFTDNVGAHDYNMDLSQKRASSVRDYLVGKGIPPDLITAEGKGPDSPISDNNSIEGRATNRRVEIVVQPKKS
jgi:outer membrane protein OmpA-like peptidoglycan-associated protein